MCKKIYISIVLIIVAFHVTAQDPQFSQFYAFQMSLNPAFTGNTVMGRFAGNYRHQWPSIPGAYVSQSFSYDHNIISKNSGVGLLMMKDKAGSLGLRFSSIGACYAYGIKLSRKYRLRAGIRYSYVSRGINFNDLVFGDQIANGGGPSVSKNKMNDGVSYSDLSTGVVFFNQEDYWIGAAIDHLNEPNQSLITDGSAILPRKYSIHAGYNIPVNESAKGIPSSIVTITGLYKAQLQWDQLDIGAYYTYKPVIFGLWYRGIPLLKAYKEGYGNNDALVFMVGYKIESFRIGYSYDITVSRLFGNTPGSHEVAVVFEYPLNKETRRRRMRKFLVPCAKF